jgi:hypothetical protein
MALRPAARRFGSEVSWQRMLNRQDTTPFGLFSTLQPQWRLVIQDFFGARHVARLSSWQISWQAGNSVHPGPKADVYCSNPTISVFFYNSKEGPLQVFEAVPLYCPHYGQWRHMPPISYTCVESTKGPRTHAMSPPLRDCKLIGKTIPQPAKTTRLLRGRIPAAFT